MLGFYRAPVPIAQVIIGSNKFTRYENRTILVGSNELTETNPIRSINSASFSKVEKVEVEL